MRLDNNSRKIVVVMRVGVVTDFGVALCLGADWIG
jgi:hypothetical protein